MIDFIFEKKLYNSGPFDAEHLLWYQNSILVHERSMITLLILFMGIPIPMSPVSTILHELEWFY